MKSIQGQHFSSCFFSSIFLMHTEPRVAKMLVFLITQVQEYTCEMWWKYICFSDYLSDMFDWVYLSYSRMILSDTPGEAGLDILVLDCRWILLFDAEIMVNLEYHNIATSHLCNHQTLIITGPLKETVDNFWRIVWEYKVEAIVMLTDV